MPSTLDSNRAARFIPGRILADRYRVIERVGEGAMGEVYRADDLKLGQIVALKFLSVEGRSPARIESLMAEVRVARQVSHPHVCRVHDVEEMDGLHFLSMEFVDGEDLASLLRRIGHLPPLKAIEVAHEIGAGLSAIHDRGVLHRDLKPANVMLDGRGHARITDFGLAELQDSPADPGVIVGTPAYLAPEILSGEHGPDVRSDVYGFGLVLYELFTGRKTVEANTLPELIHARCNSTPESPARLMPNLDPRIDRAIMRCLERDPARRPASARAVTALLPGGDVLAAAIAAGETPTPEMVAESRDRDEGLRPAAAWACLAVLAASLLLVTALAPRTRLVPALPLEEPAEVMAARARDLLRERGLTTGSVDHTYGYAFDPRAIEHIAGHDRSAQRWNRIAEARPPVVTFWYRQSPADLTPAGPWYRVTWDDPPPLVPGMVGVKLDPHGNLVEIDARPSGPRTPVFPDVVPEAEPESAADRLPRIVQAVRPALFLLAMLIGAWLARRNWRAGRGDPKRAARVALALPVLRMMVWLLGGHHTLGTFTQQLMTNVAWGLYDFAYGWVFYMAVEPYVRQLWPRVLIAWARLLDGRHADARVGREVLVGCLVGAVISLAIAAHQMAPTLLGVPPGRPDSVGYVEHQLSSLIGIRQELAELATLWRSKLVLAMGFVVILVTARIALRRRSLAMIAATLIFVPLALPKGELLALNLGLATLVALMLVLVMMRFGLLAAVVALLTHATLHAAPLGMGMASWPASRTVLALALVLGAGAYGFVRSLAGRPAIKDVLAAN